MITKTELNRIALQSGLNLYQQEKDYLLKLFLFYYYQKYHEAVFKGGTCLKYTFGIERFSEDLDFNIKNVNKFKLQVNDILHNLKAIGIESHFIKEELFADSYTCEIAFAGPLFDGKAQTRNKFRIDAGYRTGTFLKAPWKLIQSEYPETSTGFLVLMMHPEEIMVEKVAALFNRKKGRDFYDLWFLISSKVPLNKELLQKKLKKEKVKIDHQNICSKEEYERDMSKLVSRMIPYEQVKEAVLGLLRNN